MIEGLTSLKRGRLKGREGESKEVATQERSPHSQEPITSFNYSKTVATAYKPCPKRTLRLPREPESVTLLASA
jgi:hypothetical protein